ncbi:MAG: hypothetical protein KGQ66_15220 [Acidobacteriota bacterium]|nr:hypothetical protein [Acidobacteriota bacterium]
MTVLPAADEDPLGAARPADADPAEEDVRPRPAAAAAAGDSEPLEPFAAEVGLAEVGPGEPAVPAAPVGEPAGADPVELPEPAVVGAVVGAWPSDTPSGGTGCDGAPAGAVPVPGAPGAAGPDGAEPAGPFDPEAGPFDPTRDSSEAKGP